MRRSPADIETISESTSVILPHEQAERSTSLSARGVTIVIPVYNEERTLEEIDRLMRDHVRFLEECFRAGVFLAAGRQVPRVGGVILATGVKRAELEAVMAEDPFVRENAATFEITEFRTSLHLPTLAPFADPGTRAVR